MAIVVTRSLGGVDLRARGAELLKLQHAAYAIEAKLIGDERIPPLHENEKELLSHGLCWIVTLKERHLIGALGYTIDDDVVDIDRLIVAPDHHRMGIGKALMEKAVEFAAGATVSTGRLNIPARGLYERLGFQHEADFEAVPGLWVSRYSRSPANH